MAGWSRARPESFGMRNRRGRSETPAAGRCEVFAHDARWARRAERVRRRPDRIAPERLEGRELLSYSPLGFSLPDLTVTGRAAPIAAYGGPLAVEVDVRNLGASSLIEPLNLEPGAGS